MMRLIFPILFIIAAAAFGNNKTKSEILPVDKDVIEFIRTNYYASVENDELVKVIEDYIVENFSNDTDKYPDLILAYVAALESVKSKHAFWPFTKLKYFNNSMDIFEKVVERNPENLEIRFLRFTILHYVPSFLGRSKEREEDTAVIIKELLKRDYSSINPEIQKGIVEFLIMSERLNPSQEKLLKDNFSFLAANE